MLLALAGFSRFGERYFEFSVGSVCIFHVTERNAKENENFSNSIKIFLYLKGVRSQKIPARDLKKKNRLLELG